MSATVVTPDQVLSLDGRDLRTELHEAVINAYMMKYGAGVGGLRGNPEKSTLIGSGDDAEFVFDYVRGGGRPDRNFGVKYPSGAWREVFLWAPDDDSVSHGDSFDDWGGAEVTLFDATGKWEEIRQIVDSWLDPWVQRSPNPNDFKPAIDELAYIANQLYVGDARAGTPGAEDDPSSNASSSGPVDFRTALEETGVKNTGISETSYAFNSTYGEDIWHTVAGQQSMATALGLAVTAEAMAWNQTYKDLQQFIGVAIHDFNSYAASTSGSGQGTAVALSAVATVSGLAGGTVGVAFPPFGIAMAGVSASAALLGLMFPATAAAKDESVVLEGGDYMAYWGSFKQQLITISDNQATAEINITTGLYNVLEDERNTPDNYSLTRKGQVGNRIYGDQAPNDNWGKMMKTDIDVIPIKLKRVSGACEMIGDHQVKLADILEPSILRSWIWYRPELPEAGRIGINHHYGPEPTVELALTRTADLLRQEGRTSRRVAEQVMAWALDFEAVDDQNRQVLNGFVNRWADHWDDGEEITLDDAH